MTGKTSPSRPKVPDKADDKEQSERFIEAARQHEASESGDPLSDAFKRLATKADSSSQRERAKSSKTPR